jgi:hypothetical protein
VSAAADRAATCGFCNVEFREDRAQPACRSCPLSGLCHTVRCPHCGYENPIAPGWIERLSRWAAGAEAT